MIELSRHIENLMLKHDCVIVPGLGGFVTQYVSAQRVDSEELFLPPHRSVGFNQQLTLNDGLLVQSYMQAYDTSYPETVKLIENAVRQLKDELQREGVYELAGIGRLSLGMGDKYNFTPCEAGVLSPELYGLDSLSLKELTSETKEVGCKPSAGSKKKINVQKTEKEYTISINRELVNYFAAAVVAVFFYFLWATPVNNSVPSDQMAASVVYENLFFHNETPAPKQIIRPVNPKQTDAVQQVKNLPQSPAAHTVQATDLKKETAAVTQQKAHETLQAETANRQQTDSTQEKAVSDEGKYSLVLASAISSKNAETFIKALHENGYPEARSYKRGKMVRVLYGHYATEEQAQKALQKLRDNESFDDAWIIETK